LPTGCDGVLRNQSSAGKDITRTLTVGSLRRASKNLMDVDLYTDNTLPAFTSHLSQPIDLGTSSDLEVVLCEISYRPPQRLIVTGVVVDTIEELNVFVYCYLIAPQFVGEHSVRALRTIMYPLQSGHIISSYLLLTCGEKAISRNTF
jgi:hypothetical protein